MQSPTSTLMLVLVALGAFGCGSLEEEPATGPHVLAEPTWARRGEGGASTDNTCPAGQMILEGEVVNARDLGGVALADGHHVKCGALYRGGPLRLSEAGCLKLAQLGVRSVVDLRTESERESTPDAACITAEQVSTPLPIPYNVSGDDYLNDLHESASIAAAFATFGDAETYPVYFHCTYGRDRTGVVAALLLLTLGASREAVMSEYLLSERFVGAYPDALDAVLDEIQARGGAEAVLKNAGVTGSQIATLRAQAIGD